jgi:nucleoside-diphosphate-sugar epimerase
MVHTILGAGGAVGKNLCEQLLKQQKQVRLVGRKTEALPGAEVRHADVLQRDSLRKALEGSGVVYLLVGLAYETKVWEQAWPLLMRNVLDVCHDLQLPLVFFDNVYMYGPVEGIMNEQTPFQPSSRKGAVRQQVAQMLLSDVSDGKVKALIARSADFYGPHSAAMSLLFQTVIGRHLKGQKAQWLANADVPHSFTYVPDAARALILLAEDADAWNQTWHLPTAAPPATGRELVELSARLAGAPAGVQVISPLMLRMIGLFVPVIRESIEMLYQYKKPYHFDSTAFERRYRFNPTPYQTGIEETIAFYRN